MASGSRGRSGAGGRRGAPSAASSPRKPQGAAQARRRRIKRYTLLRIRIPEVDRPRYQGLANELGLSLSEVVVTLLDAAERRMRGSVR